MRIGAVPVPLSTLLTPRELHAQLRAASVQHLIAVAEFRGHRYLDGIGLSPELPALRTICTADRAATPPSGLAAGAAADALSRG
ncbi:MAG: long-chain fatty acid--CoA ligase, partial [Mycobacterium sp.]